MAADMHIHVLTNSWGPPEEQVRRFIQPVLAGNGFDWTLSDEKSKHFNDDYDAISNTPSVWVGEVSWLKAALFDDADTFIPRPVDVISEAIQGIVVIDDALIAKVEEAMQLENQTGYSIASNEVIEFLKEYKGHRAFTVSW